MSKKGDYDYLVQNYPLHVEVIDIIEKTMGGGASGFSIRNDKFGSAGADQSRNRILYPKTCLEKDSLATFAFIYAHELSHTKTGLTSDSFARSIITSASLFNKNLSKINLFAATCYTIIPEASQMVIYFLGLSASTHLSGVVFDRLKNPFIKRDEFAQDLTAYKVTGVLPSKATTEHVINLWGDKVLENKLISYKTSNRMLKSSYYPSFELRDRNVTNRCRNPNPDPRLLELFQIDATKARGTNSSAHK